MIHVLSDSPNRVANLLFVAFNILAAITIFAGMIEVVIVFYTAGLKTLSGPWQFLILGAVCWWNVFLAAIYLTMAQALRFLANISANVSRMALTTP